LNTNQLPKCELHAVTRMTIFDIQVCSLASEDDALAWVRGACPAGTTGNWQKQQDPDLVPIACADEGGRTHYVFSC
jgi:hypothetical protein